MAHSSVTVVTTAWMLLVCKVWTFRHVISSKGLVNHDDSAEPGAPTVAQVSAEHLSEGKFKIIAFGDVHGRVPEAGVKYPQSPRYSNFADFKDSRLGQQIQQGSATVLAYLGDMSQCQKPYEKTDPTAPCCGCAPAIAKEIEEFANWMGNLPRKQYPVKILIPGNHDACLDPLKASAQDVERLEAVIRKNGIHYLGGGSRRIDTISVVAHSNGTNSRLNIVGSGISLARSLGCTGAFQIPPLKKPELSTLPPNFQKFEEACGDQCSQERYEAENDKTLDPLQQLSDEPHSVDVLLMHGPPDNAGATFQKAPGGPIVDVVQKIKPSLFITGHIHEQGRSVGLGEPYPLGDVQLHIVAVKKMTPETREEAPRFNVDLEKLTWYLEGKSRVTKAWYH